jgi:ABC-type sugar transport system substrate-binding protein
MPFAIARCCSLSIACWLLVALCGCHTGLPPGGRGTGGRGIRTATRFPKSEADTGKMPVPPGRLKIAGIGFQNDQFFKLVEAGMADEATKEGVDLSRESSGGNLDKEVSLVQTFMAKRVDAIAIAPLSGKASIPALQRAAQSGIKIVTFDSALDAGFPVSAIRSDQEALGRPTGEEAKRYIQERLGGKASVAMISYLGLLPEPASQRNKGFEDQIRTLPGVKIVARQDAWLAPNAVNVADGILTAHPDLDLIWAANEGGTVGAVTAVKNTGRAGKVAVFGTDISDQIADFLLAPDNVLQAVTGQKPFDIGRLAIQTSSRAAMGEPVAKQVLLPGLLFTRSEPEEVRKYQAYLRGLAK